MPDDVDGLVAKIRVEIAESRGKREWWRASQADLQATYGASRAAVRQALGVLESAGEVTCRAAVGWVDVRHP